MEAKSIVDPWTLTARSMQTSITEMAAWIHTKKWDYVSVYMSDDEASLIQSTVTSFIATTANEIEGLRQSLLTDVNSASTRHQHKTGIVQILLTILQLEIAQPFRGWQKQRQRAAVQLWQNPYSCTLVTAAQQKHAAAHRRGKSSNKQTTAHDQELDAALGLDDDADMDHDEYAQVEQRFLPRRPSHRLQHDFLAAYYPNDDNTDDEDTLQRPVSVLNRRKRPKSATPATSPTATPSKDAKRSKTWSFASKKQEQPKQKPQAKRSYFGASSDDNDMDDDGDNDDQNGPAQQLQQEALILTATVESDLDNVQKMEQMMVDITALLGQFSNLVSEQQEDVWEIHDAVAQTKDNMQKGQENLVDAAERTKKSKHWTPALVTGSGVMLLLFHWLRA
jgi:hypothetical protein